MGLLRTLGRVSLAMALGLALAAAPSPALADTVLYLAHAQKQDDPYALMPVMAATFQRELARASNGALRVEIFPNGWLGGNRDTVGLVNDNVVQTAIVTAGGISGVYPQIAVPEIPFAFDSAAVAEAVLDGPFGRRMAGEIAGKSNLVTLGFGDSGGFYALTNAAREIRLPQDVRQLRLRTIPGFGAMDAMIAALGATPVKVSSRDEATALASGVVDGQMNTVSYVLASRYDEVQKYVTLASFMYAPLVWVINKQTLAALSPEQRAMVTAAAEAGIAAGRQATRALDQSDRGLPALRKRMSVHLATAEERTAFKAAMQPAAKDYIARTFGAEGSGLVDTLFQGIAEAERHQGGAKARP